ncbi:hypothetical protein [Massilia varians]|uniref:hypothetical protein n=1 Tax=Massilia varians TaxID=457921 RepID=UPI00248F4D8C|nr:hypothetical protein [Massilia varians]
MIDEERRVSRQRPATLQCALPRGPASIKTGRSAPSHARQRRAFAIMAAPLLIVLILMSGMARAVAIAAARKLDGSKEGITAVRSRMMLPLIDSRVLLHKATSIATPESFGYVPGASPCPC